MMVFSTHGVTADAVWMASDGDVVKIRLALTGYSVKLITSHLPNTCAAAAAYLRRKQFLALGSDLSFSHLREGGNVMTGVCLSVCLSLC